MISGLAFFMLTFSSRFLVFVVCQSNIVNAVRSVSEAKNDEISLCVCVFVVLCCCRCHRERSIIGGKLNQTSCHRVLLNDKIIVIKCWYFAYDAQSTRIDTGNEFIKNQSIDSLSLSPVSVCVFILLLCCIECVCIYVN